jgi:hypothetical protein
MALGRLEKATVEQQLLQRPIFPLPVPLSTEMEDDESLVAFCTE